MTYPLSGPVSYAELDEFMSGWWGTSGTVGTAGSGGYPTYFLNEPPNTLTFVLAPSVVDTAHLVVSRLPLVSFTLQTSPEIETEYHEGLLDWAAHLAFMKPDTETLNLNLAKLYEDAFTERFGQIGRSIREAKVDGVILYIYRYCDPFGFEVSQIKGYIERIGKPILYLEDDYSMSSLGRLRTRIQAFLELMS
jgi:hypothetical protein